MKKTAFYIILLTYIIATCSCISKVNKVVSKNIENKDHTVTGADIVSYNYKINKDSLDSIRVYIDRYYYGLYYDTLYNNNVYNGIKILKQYYSGIEKDLNNVIITRFEELNDSMIIYHMGHLNQLIYGYMIRKEERESGEERVPMTGNFGGYQKEIHVNIKSGKYKVYETQ
ncbi:hypothetical protein [Saccharicrinis aurantiacus]|uniref:hypothetical protein n=1 Tax=Saccharicrinis aurantiacus TaxID=1849719 RepID=UPI00248FD7E6|nr:hypothetical protein [Saccharicrinis aurantiacus]